MGGVVRISGQERAAAVEAAARHMGLVIGRGVGLVSPDARLGTLSDHERAKLVEAVIAGWIVERSRQLTAERLIREEFLLAMGETPEPMELALCELALPALADLVEQRGLTEQPIGTWSRDDVIRFVWTAAELILKARLARDERPGPANVTDDLLASIFAG